MWGFSIYRASLNDYQPSGQPSGLSAGTPEHAPSTPPAASTSVTPPPGSHPPKN